MSFLFTYLCKQTIYKVNKPSMLQSLKSYKNSQAQQRLHDYIRDENELSKLKQEKIDYEFISKESSGVMYFRQFAFQEKTEEVLVPHLDCELIPLGIWTAEESLKEIRGLEQLTRTQKENSEILDHCENDIQKAFKIYYANLGKSNYRFEISEEINKINNMTEEEFKQFSEVLWQKQHQKEGNSKSAGETPKQSLI